MAFRNLLKNFADRRAVRPGELPAEEYNLNAERTDAVYQLQRKLVTIDTAAATAAKDGVMTGEWADYTPQAGDRFRLLFTLGQTVSTPTLTLGGVGPFPIQTPNGSNNSSNTAASAGRGYDVTFDGAIWSMDGPSLNTTYSEITEANVNSPASTTAGLISGRRAALVSVNGVLAGDTITTPAGFTTVPRWLHRQRASVLVSGDLYLSHFRCALAGNRTQVTTYCNTGSSGTAPTVCRIALYRVETSGIYTYLTSTANDVTIWNTNFTGPTKAMLNTVAFVAGAEYALGILCITAGTAPVLTGAGGELSSEASLPPRINGRVTGATEATLTANIAAATPVASDRPIFYARFS